jgi:hypothetical protein
MSMSTADYISGPLSACLHRLVDIPAMQRGRVFPATNTVKFSYKNWNSDPEEVFVNGLMLNSGFTVDRAAGTLTFANAIQETDEIRARYRFKYFDDATLTQFLNLAIQDVNNYPPATGYTFGNEPGDWEYVITLGAYALALETVRMDLQMWDARLVFPDPADARASIDAKMATVAAQRDSNLKRIKGLIPLQPASVSSGRFRVPNTPAATDLQQYAILRF